MHQRYSLDAGVEISGQGKELLQAMLLPDPKKRIPLEAVMTHPWFTTNLPPEAATMNDSYLKAGFPASHQSPEAIKGLLEEAKGRAAPGRYGEPGSGGGAQDSYTAMIEDEIREVQRSQEVQQFVHQYGR